MKTPLIAIAVLISFVPALSHAQAIRTWVSGVGDDANPCSRTAPGKTFAGAISKTAASGVINVLDPGSFGVVTITKSITIDGDAAEGNILASGTYGVVINAGATDVVVLRNLSIEGVGTGLSGVRILSAGAVHIEDCRINGFVTGIDFQDSAADARLFVKDTTIHKCTANGISLAPTVPATAQIEDVNIGGCGDGIVASTNCSAVVEDTTVSGNAGVGFLVEADAQMSITRGTSANNNIGVQSAGLATLSNSTIANNAADGLLIIKPGKIQTRHNNDIFGNSPDGKGNVVLRPK